MQLRTQLTLAAGLFLLAPVILFFAIDFLRDRVVKQSHLEKIHEHSESIYDGGLYRMRDTLLRPFFEINPSLQLIGGEEFPEISIANFEMMMRDELQFALEDLVERSEFSDLSVALYDQRDRQLLARAGKYADTLDMAVNGFQFTEATGFILGSTDQPLYANRVAETMGNRLILFVAALPAKDFGDELASELQGAVFIAPTGSELLNPFPSDGTSEEYVSEISAGFLETPDLGNKFEVRGANYAGFASSFPLIDIFGTERGEIVLVRDTTDEIVREEKQDRLVYGGFTVLIFASIILLLWFFNRSFRPLNQIIDALRALTRHDFDWQLPRLNRKDELGLLSETLHDYRNSLIDRERLEDMSKKMQFAAEIQRSILPHNMSVSHQIEVAADMIPAEEVGGDFYDYFQMPDGRTAIVVADVADKGPGSALFGALSSAMIRATAGLFDNPAKIITTVNNQLADRNDAKLFVTLFLGIIDPKTGTLTYCNAGHEPPYVMRHAEEGSEKKVDILPGTKCIPLGLVSGAEFHDAEFALGAGDTLVLYTDGITEATNSADMMFTRDRLNSMLGDLGESQPDKVMSSVLESVENFAGDSGQADDITLLVARMNEFESQTKH